MTVRTFTAGVLVAAAVSTMACGGGVPECSDTATQDAMKEVYAKWVNGYDPIKRQMLAATFDTMKAEDMVLTPEEVALSAVRTDDVDETAKKVTCVVDTTLTGDNWVSRFIKLPPKFDREFGEMKAEAMLEAMDDRGVYGRRTGVRFNAQRTEDGQVVVEMVR